MPDNIGFSFAPGADQQLRDQSMPGGGSPQGTSPQQAVKILSLRVPKQLPANAPVSRDLLNAPGGAGSPGLTSMIQALMQAFLPTAARGPQAPTTQPTFGSSAPQPMDPMFQGYMDTPPMQEAPPLFNEGAGAHGNVGSPGGGSGNLNGFSALDVARSNQNPLGLRFKIGENNQPDGPAKGFNFNT